MASSIGQPAAERGDADRVGIVREKEWGEAGREKHGLDMASECPNVRALLRKDRCSKAAAVNFIQHAHGACVRQLSIVRCYSIMTVFGVSRCASGGRGMQLSCESLIALCAVTLQRMM